MSEERYVIKEKLGEGGSGSVFLAHDNRLDREVALKRINPDDKRTKEEGLEELLKEARILSSIQHPNIVTVYDAHYDMEGPYVVMEHLLGRNVDDLISDNAMMAEDFREFSTQVLEGLVAAHDLNLLHRDIKPCNIILKWLPSGKFQVKLLDFGIAKFSDHPSKQTVDTGDAVFGSIYFMAPEQFERRELDARTDLYALGCVFYFCLSTLYPFRGESAADVMSAHLNHYVTPLNELRPDLPEWISDWVMWLINRDMEHRPETAQEALTVFRQHNNSEPLFSKETQAVSIGAQRINTPQRQFLLGQSNPSATSAINIKASKPAPSPQNPSPVFMSAQAKREQNKKSYSSTVPTTARAASRAGSKDSSSGKNAALVSLVVLLLIAVGLLVLKLSSSGEVQAVNTLLEQIDGNNDGRPDQDIPTNQAELQLLLNQLLETSAEFDNEIIYQRLAPSLSIDGTDLDDTILGFALNGALISNVKRRLIDVVGHRRSDVIREPLLEFVKTAENTEEKIVAIKALRGVSNVYDLEFFLQLLNTEQNQSVLRASENTAASIIKRSDNKRKLTEVLTNGLINANTPNVENTIIRLIGQLEGEDASKMILEALNSGKESMEIAALTAIRNSDDLSLVQPTLDYWLGAVEPEKREKAFDALFRLAQKHYSKGPEAQKFWLSLAEKAQNYKEKDFIMRGAFSTKEPFAMKVVKYFLEDTDDNVSERAEMIIERMVEN